MLEEHEVTTPAYSGNDRFFNIQNYYEDTSVVELFKGPLGTALVVITFIGFVLYRYVSVVNRSRDEKVGFWKDSEALTVIQTMIYPIVAHLYKIVNFISYFFLSVAFINFIVFLWPNLVTLLINFIVIIVAGCVLVFFSPIINFQLFFLSFYRFLLYVASDSVSERLQEHRENIVLGFNILAYSFVSLYYAAYLLAAGYYCILLSWFPILESLPLYEIFMFTYIGAITIEISSIFSCIPYILMILKIIKFKKMMTQTFASPEHYIIYQVVIISVIKLGIVVSATVYTGTFQQNAHWTISRVFFGASQITIVPIVLFTYLFCNKANVQEFRKFEMLSKRTWRIVIFGVVPPVVQPEEPVFNVSETVEA